MEFRFTGLVAATFTPLSPDGSLNLNAIGPMVDQLIERGVSAMYVCGSTGEGPSLTTEERKATAAEFVRASDARLPVVVQVGHSSLADARDLAAHAQQIGAAAISAVAPYYFKPDSVEVLAGCLAEITADAQDLPFYYYHIPAFTGVGLNLFELLRVAETKIPTLVGIKYTAPTLFELQSLLEFEGGRFDIVHGVDEMLLAGLVTGAKAAIGSTYNFASPLYLRLIEAFQKNDITEARRWQSQATEMIRSILSIAGVPSLKAAMNLSGVECGPTRLPLAPPCPEKLKQIEATLEEYGLVPCVK